MPKYVAKGYLLHKGKLVKPGGEVELTTEQAERLGDKVGATVEETEEVTETFEVQSENETYEVEDTVQRTKPLKKYNVEELKEIAHEYGIEGYSEMKKAELIEAIEARR